MLYDALHFRGYHKDSIMMNAFRVSLGILDICYKSRKKLFSLLSTSITCPECSKLMLLETHSMSRVVQSDDFTVPLAICCPGSGAQMRGFAKQADPSGPSSNKNCFTTFGAQFQTAAFETQSFGSVLTNVTCNWEVPS